MASVRSPGSSFVDSSTDRSSHTALPAKVLRRCGGLHLTQVRPLGEVPPTLKKRSIGTAAAGNSLGGGSAINTMMGLPLVGN